MTLFKKTVLFFAKQRKILNLCALFLCSAVVSFHYFKTYNIEEKIISPLVENSENRGEVLKIESSQTAPTPDPNRNTLGVLLLGYGGAGHQGGYLADVIMVAFFDFDKKTLSFISIPRDTWYENTKVNSLLSVKGNALQTDRIKNTVSKLTGLPLQYVLGVDFVGFQRLVGENFKGINVDVPETFQDDWYPIRGEEVNPCGKTPEEIAELTNTLSGFALEKEFPCRYEKIYFSQGKNVMHGGDALKYVRSRHSSSDFARSERQKVVLLGLRDKIFSAGFITDAPSLFMSASKNISTDLNLEAIEFLLPLLKTSLDLSVKNITLSTQNVFTSSTGSAGQFILIPKENFESVKNYINQQMQ